MPSESGSLSYTSRFSSKGRNWKDIEDECRRDGVDPYGPVQLVGSRRPLIRIVCTRCGQKYGPFRNGAVIDLTCRCGGHHFRSEVY